MTGMRNSIQNRAECINTIITYFKLPDDTITAFAMIACATQRMFRHKAKSHKIAELFREFADRIEREIDVYSSVGRK